MIIRTLALSALLGGALIGCGDKDDTGEHDHDTHEADADTDSDTDADTDADTDSDTDADTDADADSEIAKMQLYDGYTDGDVVTVSAIATSPTSGYGFFMADGSGAHTGIWVYTGGDIGQDVVAGSTVDVTGTLTEYQDSGSKDTLTEIDATKGSVTVTGKDTVPAATVLTSAELAKAFEDYEGVLVQIDGASITNPALGYGEFEIDGSVRVDDYFVEDFKGVKGDSVDIVGPLHYTYGDYKIEATSIAQ